MISNDIPKYNIVQSIVQTLLLMQSNYRKYKRILTPSITTMNLILISFNS